MQYYGRICLRLGGFVLGLEDCNAEAMLARLAALAGKLQVEITRTIVARNCCPNVDCLLLDQDAADEGEDAADGESVFQ